MSSGFIFFRVAISFLGRFYLEKKNHVKRERRLSVLSGIRTTRKEEKKKSRSRVWCQSVGYRCGWARRPPSVGSTLVTVSSRTAKIERPSISSGLTLEEEELGVYIYIYTYSGWIHAAAAQCIAGKKNRIIHSDVFWQQIRRRSQPALLSFSSSSFWERDEFAAMEKM